jgi:hypothetical protein
MAGPGPGMNPAVNAALNNVGVLVERLELQLELADAFQTVLLRHQNRDQRRRQRRLAAAPPPPTANLMPRARRMRKLRSRYHTFLMWVRDKLRVWVRFSESLGKIISPIIQVIAVFCSATMVFG